MKVSLRDTATIPPLAALVYRFGKGCRQYAFETSDDLAAWAARHPYRNEQLRVMPVKDRKIIGDRWMPATEAADYVRTAHGQNAIVIRLAIEDTMKAAYADPPYLGLAEAFYGKMHPEAAEYDKPETHQRLIERLMDEYDCWAMSLHEPALREILRMCPQEVRVASWVKPFASFKKNVTRAWTWEPVIFSFHRARKRTIEQLTWRDHIAEPIAMMRGFPGAKPARFCYWVFEGLNLTPDDEFHDLFPGSGAVGEAWEKWKAAHGTPEQFELEAT